MTKTRLLIGSAAAVALAAAVAYGSFAGAQPYGGGGWGMMGRGYGPGMMQGWGSGGGPGMMQNWGSGGGYGPGWMHGRAWRQGYGPQNCPWFQGGTTGSSNQQGNLNLSTDDVKARFEQWITAQGNPRLKVGEIRAKDADNFEVDIVTKDNSLVQQFLINRQSGFTRPSGG